MEQDTATKADGNRETVTAFASWDYVLCKLHGGVHIYIVYIAFLSCAKRASGKGWSILEVDAHQTPRVSFNLLLKLYCQYSR